MKECNISFLIAALVFLLLQFYHFMLQRRLDDIKNRVFRFFFLIGIGDILLDLICTLLIAQEKAEYAPVVRVLITILYLAQVLVPYAFAGYVIALREELPHIKESLIRWGIPALIMVLVVISNPLHGLLFTIDDKCCYIHGVGYMWMFYYVFVYILFAVIHCILRYKEIGWKKIGVICEFLVVASVCVSIQALNEKLLMTGFGVALGISILFFTIQNPYGDMDNLTGTLDKQYFEKWLREKVKRKHNLNLITVDIQLKKINKFWGTKTGDKLLVQVSRELQRISDMNHVFRLEGKRFVVVLESLAEYEAVRDSLKHFFEKEFKLENDVIHLPAVLCGITDVQKWTETDKLIAYIEYLVSMVPETEKTMLVQGNEKTLQGFLYEQEVEHFLDTAIEQDLFEVYYQPVYDIMAKQFVTLEALSRLNHPALGAISPEIFIGIAERNGQIAQIGQLQFRKICRFVKAHPELLQTLRNIKFNLSPSELMRPGYSHMLIETIREAELPFSFFQFEVTETVATEYSEMLYQAVKEFVEAGIGLCLDDFGAGYANLDTVLRLPFHCIKLDRSLLRNICENEQAAKFYRNIVAVMQNMGYYVVAEGVETVQEVNLLTEWNVNMIQGYYYSKPLNETEILKKLRIE